MLTKTFALLDQWVSRENEERRREGSLGISRFEIKVLGQSALIEAKVNLDLYATKDVDAYTDGPYVVKVHFDKLLQKKGKYLDFLSDEIWMPKETRYQSIFAGKNFKGMIAIAEFVLISKALKAPDKNKFVIAEYLAKGPSKLFYDLANQYKVNLEEFV
jgi:hypothetical protein